MSLIVALVIHVGDEGGQQPSSDLEDVIQVVRSGQNEKNDSKPGNDANESDGNLIARGDMGQGSFLLTLKLPISLVIL